MLPIKTTMKKMTATVGAFHCRVKTIRDVTVSSGVADRRLAGIVWYATADMTTTSELAASSLRRRRGRVAAVSTSVSSRAIG